MGAVVVAEHLVGGAHDDFLGADGQVICQLHAGAAVAQHGDAGAVAGGIAGIELAAHDAALVVDGVIGEGGTVCKVAQHGEGEIHGVVLQVGQVEHVDGVQQAGVGVHIAAEAEATLLHGGDELVALVVAGAVEYQVLQQVGDAFFMLLLIQRAHIHIQADAGAALGLCRGADDVLEAIGQLATRNLRVLSQLSELGGGGLGVGRLGGGFLCIQGRNAERQRHNGEYVAVFHALLMGIC